MTWLALALLLVAVVTDLRKREIPNWIPVALLVCAIGGELGGLQEVGWIPRLVGVLVGFGIGALFFAVGAWGGGDAKLLAALGAVLGWEDLFRVLFLIAVVGGLLAVWAGLRGRREIAYAPAFALGMLIFLVAQYGGLHVLP